MDTTTELDRRIRVRTGFQALGLTVLVAAAFTLALYVASLKPRAALTTPLAASAATTAPPATAGMQAALDALRRAGVRFVDKTEGGTPERTRLLARPDARGTPDKMWMKGSGYLHMIESTAAAAVERADVTNRLDAGTAFASGPYLFWGDPDFVADVRAALR